MTLEGWGAGWGGEVGLAYLYMTPSSCNTRQCKVNPLATGFAQLIRHSHCGMLPDVSDQGLALCGDVLVLEGTRGAWLMWQWGLVERLRGGERWYAPHTHTQPPVHTPHTTHHTPHTTPHTTLHTFWLVLQQLQLYVLDNGRREAIVTHTRPAICVSVPSLPHRHIH